jgi:hypothetical protein
VGVVKLGRLELVLTDVLMFGEVGGQGRGDSVVDRVTGAQEQVKSHRTKNPGMQQIFVRRDVWFN